MRDTTVAFACGITEAYVTPLLVMLTSLSDHWPKPERPLLYLLHQGLSPGSIDAVGRLVDVQPIAIDEARLRGVPRHPRFPSVAACPLLLVDLLPAAETRVIFLDADLLILDDLSPLATLDLQDKAVAAVADTAIPMCHSPRGIPSGTVEGIAADAVYFNAGVMVIDLDAWRQRVVVPRAFDYLDRVGTRVDFLHQEALNAVLWNDWHRLPARWNVLASVAGRRFDRSADRDAWQHAAVVHFAGRIKPWRVPVGGRFGASYDTVRRRVMGTRGVDDQTVFEKIAGAYDRALRDYLYPLERALWNRRLL